MLACFYMHTYTSDIHVTPLLKILATGLVIEELQLLRICDPLSENPPPAIIEFKLETILSVQVVFQLKSDYCTKVL